LEITAAPPTRRPPRRYQEADARVAWRVTDRIELAVGGTNLLHKGHVEFDEHGLPAVIPRAAYFQLRARF